MGILKRAIAKDASVVASAVDATDMWLRSSESIKHRQLSQRRWDGCPLQPA